MTLACVVKLTQGEKTVESRLQDRRREKVPEEEPQLPLTSLQLTLWDVIVSQQQRPGHEVCLGTQPLTGWTVTLFKPPSGQELGDWGGKG